LSSIVYKFLVGALHPEATPWLRGWYNIEGKKIGVIMEKVTGRTKTI
jgi:hypothetical protein